MNISRTTLAAAFFALVFAGFFFIALATTLSTQKLIFGMVGTFLSTFVFLAIWGSINDTHLKQIKAEKERCKKLPE